MERTRRRRRRRGHDLSLDVEPKLTYPITTVMMCLCAILMLCGLSSTLYLVQAHHYNVCPTQKQIKSLTESLLDITVNIEKINHNYQGLEKQVKKVVMDLPKLQYDIYYLESLADAAQENTSYKNKPKVEKPPVKTNDTKKAYTKNNATVRQMFYEKKELPFTAINGKRVVLQD